MASRIQVAARVGPEGDTFRVSGQEAKTLLLLHQRGTSGVVAFDFAGGPPFRLAAYVWALKRYHALVIETLREKHNGGWHGRFVLHTPVEILAVFDPAELRGAAA